MKNQQLKNNINELLISPTSRDNRIDSLRGLMLVLITINHYGGWLADFVWQPIGFVSDAEGFIFISGFVFSLVYGKYLTNYKLFATKIFSRFFTIYRYHFCLIIGLVIISMIFPFYNKYWENMITYYYTNGFFKYCIASIPLIYQPTLLDILPLYTISILASWPFLILLHKGKGNIAIISSFLIWFIGQFFNPNIYLSLKLFNATTYAAFNILSWQLIFMSGIYLGFKAKINEKVKIAEFKSVGYSLIIVFFSLLLLRHITRFDWSLNDYIPQLLNRGDMSIQRLLDFFAIIYVVSLILKKIPKNYKIIWLDFIGKHSLQVFSFHVVIFYIFLIPFGRGSGIYINYGNTIYLFVMLLLILSLSIPAYVHKLFMRHKANKESKNRIIRKIITGLNIPRNLLRAAEYKE